MKKTLFAIALALMLLIIPTGNAFAETSFWNASIPSEVVESLVVKSGDTVLPSGYVFQAISLKTGELQTKVITVENTGTVSWLVKPTVNVSDPDVTATWSTPEGQTIAGGASATFTLTITAIEANPSVTINIGFTRE